MADVIDMQATESDEISDSGADADEDAPSTDEKTKREKVDLETLDPNTRVSVAVNLPAGLKLALERAAESRDVNISAFCRDILAERMEYTLPAVTRTRKSKYASDEERKAAIKQAQKDRRDLVNALLAEHKAKLAANGQ